MWDKDDLGVRMLLAENHHAMQAVQFPVTVAGAASSSNRLVT